MALTQINNGDTGLVSRGKINDSFTQVDTNVTNISTNVNNIAANAAVIKLIQSKSFVSPSTAEILNSTTSDVATDLLVAITPISSTSKLRINAQGTFVVAASTLGCNITIQKKVGAGAWTGVLFGNNTYTARLRGDDSQTITSTPSIFAVIDSPGISDEIQFRVVFSSTTSGFQTKYTDIGIGIITVDEILE